MLVNITALSSNYKLNVSIFMIFVLFCLIINIDDLFQRRSFRFNKPSYPLWLETYEESNAKQFSSKPENQTRFLVALDSCHIIDWPLFDEETGPLYKNLTDNVYKCQKPKMVIERVNFTSIFIPSLLDKTNFNGLECYAESLERSDSNDKYKFGTKYGPLESVSKFENLNAVRITCFMPLKQFKGVKKMSQIYSKVIPLVPFREPLKSSESNNNDTISLTKDKPNILMLGIDSISWLQFRRHFVYTKGFLTKHKFVPMFGFNKIGDNTFPNMMGALTGYHYTTFWNSSMRNMKFDNVPLIWKQYATKGYLTSLIEDMPIYSLFNYNRAGFNRTPTSYYLRPVSLVVNSDSNNNFCYKHQLIYEFFYSWILDQVQAANERNQHYFTFSHMADLTHNYALNAAYADKPLYNLLREIFSRELNNNTVIFVYSDHGIRFGKIRRTKSGQFEERLPFLYVYIPDRFYLGSKQTRKALAQNSHRLTCHFDIHATLRHIIDGKPPEDVPFGVSLLNPVPVNRTCQSAGISEEWCLCADYRPLVLHQNSSLVQNLTELIISNINKQLNHTKCAALKLNRVEKVMEKGINVQQSKDSTVLYIIRLVLSPSNGIFEATVVVHSETNQMSIIGDISRLDQYGHQSYCIQDSVLEKFCYCQTDSSNSTNS